MVRGSHSRLQHHKKQECFGIKILAFRCQIELPEIKGFPFGIKRITKIGDSDLLISICYYYMFSGNVLM